MELREHIRTYYTDRLQSGSCCGPTPRQAPDVPSFGCGDPTGFAELQPGETVLDLGSGAGLDAFRAAERVGPSGRVLGVDMTPAMLEQARAGATRQNLANIEFRLGLIEDLPVTDASVDVIISNCVINLSSDKPSVFREAYRVLRPGGRLRASDVLRRGARLEAATEEGWCACIDGAESPEAYAEHLKTAGFVDVQVDEPPTDPTSPATYSASIRARKPAIRPARLDEDPYVERLLESTGLPLAGLADTERFVLADGGERLGVVAFEPRGPYALLRSLTVRPEARGRGLGAALLTFIEGEARRRGFRAAFGLTTTIPELLQRRGYTEVAREELPQELHASAELQGACPASARAFRKELA